jgi:hypothetical protein
MMGSFKKVFYEDNMPIYYKDENFRKNKSYICQVDSLVSKFKNIDPTTFNEYVIVIDEIDGFIKHLLMSETME